MKVVKTIGNVKLWQREKTLFLTSKRAPFSTYERVFQWVDSLTDKDTVVCFNSSEFEEEVLKALLVNRIPTVLVVMDGFRDTYNVQIEQALNENRMLIMVLKRDEPKGSGTTPRLRNQYIMSQVQHTVCGFVNPKGTVVLLLGNDKDITYLIDDKRLLAAEAEVKPLRWTVAEDKRLLRMFYEDMGIHAIHKAINRPYSTIYTRIKALAMNDEVLKGREFEDYVVNLFDLPNNKKLTLKEWRGDKTLPGVYPESNSGPDLVFIYDGRPFAIECKWRSHLPKEIEKELLPSDRQALFTQYATENAMPIYLLLGIGGLPSDPNNLYLVSLSEPIDITTLTKNTIHTPDEILKRVQLIEPTQKQISQKVLEMRKLYPYAYYPWSKEDDKRLTELYNSGKTVKELSDTFMRNSGSITTRLRILGLVKR